MLGQHLIEGLFLGRTSTVRGGLCVASRHAVRICKMQTTGTDSRVAPAQPKPLPWSTALTRVSQTTHLRGGDTLKTPRFSCRYSSLSFSTLRIYHGDLDLSLENLDSRHLSAESQSYNQLYLQ